MNRTFTEFCRDATRTDTRNYLTTFFPGFSKCATWDGLQEFVHEFNISSSNVNVLANLRDNFNLLDK